MTGLIGFAKFEFPGGDVRLCDGGFITYDSETYVSSHATWGTIGSLQSMTEGVGNEVPALQMTFLPANDATPSDIGQPGFQKSRCRFWLGEYDTATGLITGTPDLLFDGQLDQMTLTIGGAQRTVDVSVVSTAERMFQRSSGNRLSDGWHESVWPGEKGQANATALQVPVAWGVEAPPRTTSTPTTGSYYSGSPVPWTI